jgi:hypothetical protein
VNGKQNSTPLAAAPVEYGCTSCGSAGARRASVSFDQSCASCASRGTARAGHRLFHRRGGCR